MEYRINNRIKLILAKRLILRDICYLYFEVKLFCTSNLIPNKLK